MQVFAWEKETVLALSNLKGESSFLDLTMYALSSKAVGVCVLFLFTLWFFKKYGWIKTKLHAFQCGLAFIAADVASRFLFKSLFLRPRPLFISSGCNNLSCYGFVSSHASDIFSLVTVLVLIRWKNIFWGLPLAISVCLSRLFLNDHFPLDLIGGAILGSTIGFITYYSISKFAPSSNA